MAPLSEQPLCFGSSLEGGVVADEGVGREVVGAARAAGARQVPTRRVEAEAEYTDLARHHRSVGRAAEPHGDVSLTAQQIDALVVREQLDPNGRPRGAEAPERGSNDSGDEGLARGLN